MPAPTAGCPPSSGDPADRFGQFRPCAGCSSITATLLVRSTSTGCGVLLGNGGEQRTYRLNGLFRRRPVRVILDVQSSCENLGEVDLDPGADSEVQLAVGSDDFEVRRRAHRRDQTV